MERQTHHVVEHRRSSKVADGNGNGNGRISLPVVALTLTLTTILIGGLWAGVLAPMETRLGELEHEAVPEREAHQRQQDIDRRIEEEHLAILKLQDQQVPRAEHEEHWKEEAARVEAIHDNFAELAKEFHDAYTQGDVLKHLQSEFDGLNLQIHNDAKKAN